MSAVSVTLCWGVAFTPFSLQRRWPALHGTMYSSSSLQVQWHVGGQSNETHLHLQATLLLANRHCSYNSRTTASSRIRIQRCVSICTFCERRAYALSNAVQLGVEFGSKLIEIPEQGKVIKLQCSFPSSFISRLPPTATDIQPSCTFPVRVHPYPYPQTSLHSFSHT